MSKYMYCNNVRISLNDYEMYSSKEEVLKEIKRNEAHIEDCKRILSGMCCATPCDIMPTIFDSGGMIDAIYHRSNDLYEDIERMVEHNVKLRYIAENFDKCKIE